MLTKWLINNVIKPAVVIQETRAQSYFTITPVMSPVVRSATHASLKGKT